MHLPEIHLARQVEFRSLSADTEAEYDTKLADLQGWLHDQLFPDIENRPPWTVLVVKPEGPLAASRGNVRSQDVMLGFHHAIADGNGGRIFHEDLARYLNTVPALPIDGAKTQSVYAFPDAPALPEGQDNAIEFTRSSWYMVRILWATFGPAWLKRSTPEPWAGLPITFSLPYETLVRPVDLSADTLKVLLKACKANSTSLTGLLHSLVLTSMTQRLPDKVSYLVSSSPISLRPWLASTVDQSLKDTIRVLITAMNHEHHAKVLRAIRGTPASKPTDLEKTVWKNAVRVRAELTKRLETLPANDPVSLLPYISDFFSYWEAKDGEPRDLTWEVSNIGVLKSPGEEGGYKLTRAQFTNGAMVAGSGIGVNVASIAGGQLTITLSWQKEVMTAEFVNGIADDLLKWSMHFADKGCFFA